MHSYHTRYSESAWDLFFRIDLVLSFRLNVVFVPFPQYIHTVWKTSLDPPEYISCKSRVEILASFLLKGLSSLRSKGNLQTQPVHSKWGRREHLLQRYAPAGDAPHAITLENTPFYWKTKLQNGLIWRIHLFCEWKESLQHGLKGLLHKKAVISCWTNTPFRIVTFKQKREDVNQKAQLALMLQDHQGEAVTGQWPVRNPVLSLFEFQSSAALNCRADVLGEMTPNAEQQDPNSNGLCSWTSNTSNGKHKKQNWGYKKILCYINAASTAMLLCLLKRQVFSCDLSGKCQTEKKNCANDSLGGAELGRKRPQNFVQKEKNLDSYCFLEVKLHQEQ